MSERAAYLSIGDAVSRALQEGRPVVALESTLISHGMPFPGNLETALAAEQAVRDAGAVPATCAVVGGHMRAGLAEEEIEALARSGPATTKCSRRDLPILLQRGKDGATTVAATMIIAHLAGIRVFATGGIGGVHRGADQSMDISADLQELARTPVAVVCAGPKAILDIGLTLEYLETHGVPVIGYRCDELPAFYTRTSGHEVDYRIDTPREIAGALDIQRSLGFEGGMVIANPVAERYAQDAARMEQVIEQAITEAHRQGIHGKALTPFLLGRVEELTGGDSLETNIHLVLNNARLGAEIAVALADLSLA